MVVGVGDGLDGRTVALSSLSGFGGGGFGRVVGAIGFGFSGLTTPTEMCNEDYESAITEV